MMNLKKIGVILGFLLSCNTAAALPVKMEANDALATVNAVYQLVTEDNNSSPLTPPHLNKFFSAALVELVKTDNCVTKQSGEVGVLDYDPFLDGQDGEVKNLRTRVVQQSDDETVVEATFVSLNKKKSVLFDLVLEKETWRINDIHSLKDIHSHDENGERDSLFEAFAEAYPDGLKSCTQKK